MNISIRRFSKRFWIPIAILQMFPRKVIVGLLSKNISFTKQGEYLALLADAGELDGNIFKASWFAERIYASFEEYHYWIPKEYDKILTCTYNNYAELPPVKMRKGHNINFAYNDV